MRLKNGEYVTGEIASRGCGIARQTPGRARGTRIGRNNGHARRGALASQASFFEFGSTTGEYQAEDSSERNE